MTADLVAAWLGRASGWAAALALAAIVGAGALQIVCRYALNRPLSWPEEVSRLLLVWLTYLGAVALTASGEHVAVGAAYDRLPRAGRRAADLLADLVGVAFFAALAGAGIWLLVSLRGIRLPALQLPLGVLCAAVPVAAALHVYLHGAAVVRRLRGGARSPAR